MTHSKLVENACEGRWSESRARTWHESQPWLVGCNFIPSGAINQLEMWQPETFNPQEIDRELGWLAGLGMNTARVFLHDLLWKQDAEGFLARIDRFLEIAARHRIGIMFVFFDSCWNPVPVTGPQPAPIPGVHNPGWVQSPGAAIVRDSRAFDQLKDYVTGVIGHLRNDRRILVWDLWNEPDNLNITSYPAGDLTQAQMARMVTPLLARVFQWARSANPAQPLTSGIWMGDWSGDDHLDPLWRLQLSASDIISFHRYLPLEETRATVEPLKRFGRPLLCTEYMARETGSTFEAILPYFKQEKIAAYNWGAVAGKTQTHYPWDSWQKPYATEPARWHHDIFRPDGSPYDPGEAALIQSLLGK